VSAADPAELETDPRFPSGPWVGYFQQLQGRHWMRLRLTFRQGSMTGDGKDWVGPFLITGRYSVEDGRCHWHKRYLGKHDVFYQGYNEGKGIWGTWEIPRQWRTLWMRFHNGFHIWPEGTAAAIAEQLAAEADPPLPREEEAVQVENPTGVSVSCPAPGNRAARGPERGWGRAAVPA
jgi:hypothetical protein